MTKNELKDLILSQANKIKLGDEETFTQEDSNSAFDEAMRECGFDFPEDDDIDKLKKTDWLVKRMRRWFIFQLWMRYLPAHNAGDMEAKGIVENFERIIKHMDEQFEKAKEAETIFDSAGEVIGLSVYAPGLIEDRIGQSIEERA